MTLEGQVASLRGGIAERDAEIAKQLEDASRLLGELVPLRQRIAELEMTLDTIHGSRSWRLTRPLRAAMDLLRGWA